MEQNFKVKFRGVRGSYPTPRANFLRFGGNTSCVEVGLGENLLVLDAGTGIVDLGNELVREHILSSQQQNDRKTIEATILLSHVHQDHIQGLQFFKPVFVRGSKINVFGLNVSNDDLKDTLQDVLFDRVFPLGIDDVKCWWRGIRQQSQVRLSWLTVQACRRAWIWCGLLSRQGFHRGLR